MAMLDLSWPSAQVICVNMETQSARDHIPKFEAHLSVGPTSDQKQFFKSSTTHRRKQAAREDVARIATLTLLQTVQCDCGRLPPVDTSTVPGTPISLRDAMHGVRSRRAQMHVNTPFDNPHSIPFNKMPGGEEKTQFSPLSLFNSSIVCAPLLPKEYPSGSDSSSSGSKSFSSGLKSSIHSGTMPFPPGSFNMQSEQYNTPSEPYNMQRDFYNAPPRSSNVQLEMGGVQFYYRETNRGIQCKAILGDYELAEVVASNCIDAMMFAAKKVREKAVQLPSTEGWKLWNNKMQ
jgi:hypothetical protein